MEPIRVAKDGHWDIHSSYGEQLHRNTVYNNDLNEWTNSSYVTK